jgi:thiol:disulfide interchange protein
VLSCVPLLLRRLPRPGAWMEHFRQAMAFPLLATVAWLVWIFGQQTGNDGVLGLLFALVLASAGMWIGGRFAGGRHPQLVTVATALCLVGSVAVTFSVASPAAARRVPEAQATTADGVRWQPWDPDAIVRHRSEGRVVLVDFTADWCLSCKVNERVALSGGDFARRMNELGAVAMKADWTSADPRITKALGDFGRSGVPLYVVYPKSPEQAPIVLPQILTPAIVLEALERAKA